MFSGLSLFALQTLGSSSQLLALLINNSHSPTTRHLAVELSGHRGCSDGGALLPIHRPTLADGCALLLRFSCKLQLVHPQQGFRKIV